MYRIQIFWIFIYFFIYKAPLRLKLAIEQGSTAIRLGLNRKHDCELASVGAMDTQ